MANNDPRNVNVEGLSPDTASAISSLSNKLLTVSPENISVAYAAGQLLTEVVGKLRALGA